MVCKWHRQLRLYCYTCRPLSTACFRYDVSRFGDWEYRSTLEDGFEVHRLSVSQIHGFLCDNPLVIRGFLHWKNNEPRADNMRFLIGLPDGKELSWKHIKHPILPCQCPRVRSIICEEENGSCMFEKVIAGLHMIQRSVPQMPRAVDVSKEIVNGGFALNAKAMRELSRKLYDGEIVEDALDNK